MKQRMTETEAKAYAKKWVKEKIKGTKFKGEVGEPWKLLHHEVLLELTTEPVVNRVEYVLLRKPLEEIEVRLAEMEPWIWEMPEGLAEAGDAYYNALDAYNKASDAYNKASDAYCKASDAASSELNKIVKRERPNSKWNGNKIEGTEWWRLI